VTYEGTNPGHVGEGNGGKREREHGGMQISQKKKRQ